MKLTVVTPVRDGARYLDATIRSVRAQTHDDWEHLIVDGGSIDGSVEIARRHAREDARISLVCEPDEGMYDGVLKGLLRAQGEVLSWLNADDLYTPWALATVARCFADPRAAWITGLPATWDGEGRLRVVLSSAWRPRALIRAGWFHEELLGCIQQESVFFRRTLFEALSVEERETFARFSLAGDYYLWRRFALRARLDVAPTVLGGFRMHGDNRSGGPGQVAYMAEVAATGAPRIWPPLGRRLGMALRLISTLRTHFVQQAALAEQGRERRE
jgi:glycosyltransferase involved in cell wall biosynthesis